MDDGAGGLTADTALGITIDPNVLSFFTVTNSTGGAITNGVAGTAFPIDVTALDAYGNQLGSGPNVYSGTVDLSLSNGGSITPTPSAVFVNGLLDNYGVTITGADTGIRVQVVTAGGTYGTNPSGQSNTFDVAAGAATVFSIETAIAGTTQTAGVGFSVRIEAQDGDGNVDTTYAVAGIVLDDADGVPNGTISPATIDFTAGVWEGTVTVTEASPIDLRVDDGAGGLTADTALGITIDPNVLDHFLVEAGTGGNIGVQVSNSPFDIDITAQDAYNNTVVSFMNPDEVDLSLSNGGTITPTDSGVFTNGVLNDLSVTISGSAPTGVMILVVDDGGVYGVAKSGQSNIFNVTSEYMVVEIENDSAPKVAHSGDTVELLDIRITNPLGINIDIEELHFDIESINGGNNIIVDPSTLIDSLFVYDITAGSTYLDQFDPSGPGTIVVDPGIFPVDPSPIITIPSGGYVVLRISVSIKSDISNALYPNMRLKITDIEGLSINGDVAPENTSGGPITVPANYIRSSVTQIREAKATAAFNYPNPFNPRRQSTTISFYNSGTKATVKIYTITGKLVRDLTKDTPQTSGSVEVQWDGKNGRGKVVRNGVYVAVITAGGTRMMVKIAVVK